LVDDVHDGDSLPLGERVQRRSHFIPAIAGHNKETFYPRIPSTPNHALEQAHTPYRDQGLAWTLFPQPAARPRGDDEAIHGPTALSFALLARMKASTMSYA